MATQTAIDLKWMKKLTADDEMVPRGLLWATTPFVAHGHIVATDGHSLVALRDNGGSGWNHSPEGEKATTTLMGKPLGDEEHEFQPLLAWLKEIDRPCTDCNSIHRCHRNNGDGYETCFVFDCFVDRSLLFRFLGNIDSKTFTFRAEDMKAGHLLLFGGKDWRVMAMGLKIDAIKPNTEYPRYPATTPARL